MNMNWWPRQTVSFNFESPMHSFKLVHGLAAQLAIFESVRLFQRPTSLAGASVAQFQRYYDECLRQKHRDIAANSVERLMMFLEYSISYHHAIARWVTSTMFSRMQWVLSKISGVVLFGKGKSNESAHRFLRRYCLDFSGTQWPIMTCLPASARCFFIYGSLLVEQVYWISIAFL